MTFSSLRCLAASGMTLLWSMAVVRGEAAWTARFPANGGDASASAFVVSDGRHVISVALSGADAQKGRLLADHRELPAEVFLDPVSRLVVFRLSGPPGKAMKLVTGRPLAAGTVVSAGESHSGKSAGWVKRIDGKILPLALLKIDYSAAPPTPGTPLTDASGVVVAVAHQPTSGNSGYAIPIEVVKRVLEDVEKGGRVSRGWIGLNLRPEAPVPQVTKVHEGSPSALAGVKAGDVLLEIGSRKLDDYSDAVNAFYFLRPGTSVPVRLKRGEQQFTIAVTPVERRSQ